MLDESSVLELEPQPQLSQQPLATQQTRAMVENPTPRDLVRLAMANGGHDLEQIARFMQLQREWDADQRAREAHEAMKAYNKAFAAFKAMPLTIYKRKQVGYTTKDGEFVGYAHAELSDITDVVGPAMAMHGLSYRWDIQQGDARIRVTCIVMHELGHFTQVSMDASPDTSGKKNAIQSQASAVQYLCRYTLLAASGMSTKGMDDDGQGAGDRDAEDRRRQWLEDQKANIRDAATVGALKQIMEYAIGKTRENNDAEAEAELLAAQAKKLATVNPKGAKA